MSKNMNVPKLRFSEFCGEWEEKKLDDVVKFYNSKRIPLTESDREKGIYPYYGASGIIDYVKDYIFDGEYILLGEDGANIVLRNSRLVFLAKGKFWLNNHAHIFQAKESNSFLCEVLEKINYTKYNTGTAQPKLNAEVVKNIKVKLPSKQEQEKIASFLTSVDTKIEQLTKKETLLQEYKKGVMNKIFNQEIRFKDDDGSEFPEWEEKILKEQCINIYSGKTKPKENGKFNVYGSTGIIGKSDEFTHEGNYVLVARVGANAGQINYVSGQFAVTDNTLIVEVDINKALPLFILSLLNIVNLNRLVFGSGQPLITGGELKSLKLKFPCLEEQTKIANFLSSIDKKIELTTKELNSTKEFKKALLQQMFV